MFAPRWRKVLRDIWSNKTRTIIVLLAISVGVAAIGMVMGAKIIIDENLPGQYLAANPSSGTIFTLSSFDDDQVAVIRNMREISAASGARQVNVRFKTQNGEWRNLQLNAVPDFKEMDLNIISPEEGAWPPPRNEVLIERNSFQPALGLDHLSIGDTLIVEAPGGKQRELKISGTVHDISQLPSFFVGAGYGYITLDTLEWLGESREFNQLEYVVAENQLDQDHIEDIGKLVSSKLEKSGVSVIFSLVLPPDEHPAQTLIDGFSTILAAVGILSLVLSGFLIVNTISAIMTQQVRQIGIMKTIGARTGQVTGMYFFMVAAFGIMALVIAVPLGILGSVGVASLFSGFFNFDIQGLPIEPRVMLIQALIGISVPMLAAIIPIWGGVRVTVREAISEQGLGKGRFGQGIIDRLIVGLRYIFPMGRPMQISLRNTFRRKARLILTLITLSLASAIFISIFSVRASLQKTLDDALNYFDYDVQVRFEKPYRNDRIQSMIADVPGVDIVETWGFGAARRIRPDESESDSFVVYGINPDSPMVNPILVEGRWIQEGDTNGIVVNTDLLNNEEDITVGSTLRLSLEGRENNYTVVGIARGILSGANGFMIDDHFGRVTNSTNRSLSSIVRLDNRTAENQGIQAQLLEQIYRQAGFSVAEVQTIAQVRDLIGTIFNVIIGFLLGMAVLLGFVGGLGLMGTMSINVIERTREIGVMRAIGASDGAVLRIILIEGFIIGLISWTIGGLIALPTSRILTTTVGNTLLRAEPSYEFSTNGAILWLVIIIILALLASFLPARSASRLTVREVLSYE